MTRIKTRNSKFLLNLASQLRANLCNRDKFALWILMKLGIWTLCCHKTTTNISKLDRFHIFSTAVYYLSFYLLQSNRYIIYEIFHVYKNNDILSNIAIESTKNTIFTEFP